MKNMSFYFKFFSNKDNTNNFFLLKIKSFVTLVVHRCFTE